MPGGCGQRLSWFPRILALVWTVLTCSLLGWAVYYRQQEMLAVAMSKLAPHTRKTSFTRQSKVCLFEHADEGCTNFDEQVIVRALGDKGHKVPPIVKEK